MPRTYLVTETVNGTQHLVEANGPAQAISHVVKRQVTAEVANGSEVIRLIRAGVVPQSALTQQAEIDDTLLSEGKPE